MELKIIHNGPREEGSITIDTTEYPLLVIGNEVIDFPEISRIDTLEYLLEERDWGVTTRLFSDNSGTIYMSVKDSYSSYLPEIVDEPEKISLEEDINLDIQSKLIKNFEDLEILDQTNPMFLRELIKSLSKPEDSPGKSIILEENYSNIINFNRFVQKFNKENNYQRYSLSAIITIGYVFNNKRVNKTFQVKPFEINYDDSGSLLDPYKKINSNYYTEDNNILAEIKDGVLRIFPLNKYVTECVILNCELLYENIK